MSDGGSGSSRSSTKFFIGNVTGRYTEDALRNIFERFGPLKYLNLHSSGKYAFCEYFQHSHALDAEHKISEDSHLGLNFGVAREKKPHNNSDHSSGRPFEMFEAPITPPTGSCMIKQFKNIPSKSNRNSYGRRTDHRISNITPYEESNGEEKDMQCFHCKQVTINICKDCETPFCSKNCLRNAAALHISFCQKLVTKDVGFPPPTPSPVSERFSNGADVASNTGRKSESSFIEHRSNKGRPNLEGSRFKREMSPPKKSSLGYPTRFNVDGWKPSTDITPNLSSSGRNPSDQHHATSPGPNAQNHGANRIDRSDRFKRGRNSDESQNPLREEERSSEKGIKKPLWATRADKLKLDSENKTKEEIPDLNKLSLSKPEVKKQIPPGSELLTENIPEPNNVSRNKSEVKKQIPHGSELTTEKIPESNNVSRNKSEVKKQIPHGSELTTEKIPEPNNVSPNKPEVKKQNPYGSELKNLPQKKPEAKEREIPRIPFIVTVLFPENGGHWVLPDYNKKDYDKVCNFLKETNMANMPDILPTVNTWCGAQFEGDWWRVKITAVNPTKIHFMDFGNSEASPGCLKVLPQQLLDIPPLAFFIKFAEDEPKDLIYKDVRIRCIGCDGRTKIVEMDVATTPNKRPSANEMNVTPEIRPDRVKSVQTSPASNKSDVMSSDTARQRDNAKSAGKPVSSPAVTRPVSPSAVTRPVSSQAFTKPLVQETSPNEQLTSCETKSISDEERFPSNSLVFLQHITSPCEVSVSLVKEDDEYIKLSEEVAIACVKEPALTSKPPVNAIVGVLYNEDQMFYRAKILKYDGDKIHVVFVEYGNKDIVKLADLRKLPGALTCKPPAVITVKLLGVPTKPSSEGLALINQVLNQKCELIYDNLLSSGVELIIDGTNLNKILISEFDDQEKIDVPISTVYEPDKLQMLSLTEGKHDVMITFCGELEPDGELFCAPHDDILNYVLGEMPDELKEYCSKIDFTAYRPHAEELCAAIFEGEYARALALEKTSESTTRVYFVDYGNLGVVDNAHIRPLTANFKNTAAIANKCFLKGYKSTTEKKRNLISDILKQTAGGLVNAEVVKAEGGHFELIISEIEAILNEQNGDNSS